MEISDASPMFMNGNGMRHYNIDSDSDSEDEASAAVVPSKSLLSGYTTQMEEIAKVSHRIVILLHYVNN